MATHELKVWPSQFAAIVAGAKTHEWRQRDRDFKVGDELILEEFEPHGTAERAGGYTEHSARAVITWITTDFGVPDGWCVLSIKVLEVIA